MLHFIRESTEQDAVDDSTRKMYDYVRVVKEDQATQMRYMSWEEYFTDDVEKAVKSKGGRKFR